MQGTIKTTVTVAGAEWTFETGKLAGQADGAVVVTLGETQVLATATASRSVREGQDFFPLTVDIEEKMYAVGRIPGSFFRREGRASEQAILLCRLIDRPLRPAFPDGFRNEVHIIGTVFSVDHVNPHDIATLNAASAALSVSGVPFDGPIAAVRMLLVDGEWITNPTYEQIDEGVFDLVVAGRRNDAGEIDIMMVEAGATEHAWELIEEGQQAPDEDELVRALEAAKVGINQIIEAQLALRAAVEQANGPIEPMTYDLFSDTTDDILARVTAVARDRVAANSVIADKQTRNAANKELGAAMCEELADEFPDQERQIKAALRTLEKKVVRERVVAEGLRIDGRGTADLRPISAEVGVVPRVHGSGLFQRGETQVLNICTLGMLRMAQSIDTIQPDDSKRYMHNYNMPPYSTGETGFMRGPKRREIGHGALAERAVLPVVPDEAEFPYALRLVSEVLSSNGSTSMGSVCASTLALMDVGVPIKAPVAGIAMGLVYQDGKYVTLTDILGAEDAFGDMDFKVAGTRDFVTALQLDTKIQGLPSDVLARALAQAKDARLAILDVMEAAIAAPREELNPTAPRITTVQVPVDKIGEVIGPKGKVIQEIQRETGADIDIDDDGTIRVGGSDAESVERAVEWISTIANPPTPEIGKEYPGKVVNITDFGAFINILPGRDGLVHISKLGTTRLKSVHDVLSVGDEITVRVDDIDTQGRVNLFPVAGPEGAVDTEENIKERMASAPQRGDRGGRGGGDRGGRGGGDRGGRGGGDRGGRGGGGGGGGGRGGDRGGRGGGGGRAEGGRGGDRGGRSDSDRGGDRGGRSDSDRGGDGGGGGDRPRRETVSFEDSFDAD